MVGPNRDTLRPGENTVRPGVMAGPGADTARPGIMVGPGGDMMKPGVTAGPGGDTVRPASHQDLMSLLCPRRALQAAAGRGAQTLCGAAGGAASRALGHGV